MRRFKFPSLVELILMVAALITPSYQFDHEPEHRRQQPNVTDTIQIGRSSASSANYQNELTTSALSAAMSVPYFRASIPMRIYECLCEFSTLRCTKLYVLQKMEERKQWPNTGNITKDFLDQFFGEDEQMGSLITNRYREMSDKDLNKRLVLYFQRFFKNRNIKLRFLPGLMVKIVPSKENKLKISLKKSKNIKRHLNRQSNKILFYF